MKYARQTQTALDNLDVSLNRLYLLIKNSKQQEALRFMEEGELKQNFEDLQSIIKISGTNQLGASGITQTGAL